MADTVTEVFLVMQWPDANDDPSLTQVRLLESVSSVPLTGRTGFLTVPLCQADRLLSQPIGKRAERQRKKWVRLRADVTDDPGRLRRKRRNADSL